MTTVTAYATPAAKAPFEKTTIERRDVGPKDVRIKIAFAGICHSDIHTGRGEWGEVNYPLVPGHEIAGTVEEVGSDVSKFTVGEHAGVGCMVSSCGECEQCTSGEEQFCLKGMVGTYAGELDGKPTDGGYSTEIVVDENYVLHIPDGIALDEAAPLLCAGITLYSPLQPLGRGARQERRDRRHGRPRPHGCQDRARDGRRGDRAVADHVEGGGRQEVRRRPLLRDEGRRHLQEAAPAAST